MFRRVQRLFTFTILLLLLQTVTYAKPIVNLENVNQGIVSVKYTQKSDKKIKLIIEKDSKSVVHDIKKIDEFEDFALTFGNGKYVALVYRNIKDNKYELLQEKSFTLNIEDPNTVYLRSTQEISFKEEDEPIRYIKEKTKDIEDPFEKIAKIHQYIVSHITYDREKARIIEKGYQPNINDTFRTNTGICYDYSVLFAAMARSLGIETKLVKGYANYAPTTYHAWNQVLINGEWVTIDTTYDASLNKSGSKATLAMMKDDSNYIVVNQY